MPSSTPRWGGRAYSAATRGRVEKKAVSNAATWVTSAPQASRAASIQRSATGLCSGASSERPAMQSRTPSSITVGPVNRVPPCTTRWATAAGGSAICPRNPRRAGAGSRRGPVRCCVAICRGGNPASPGAPATSKAASLTDVLPVLTVNTIIEWSSSGYITHQHSSCICREAPVDTQAVRSRLLKRREELQMRASRASADLRHESDPLSADFAEQVTQRETDDVLGAISESAQQE